MIRFKELAPSDIEVRVQRVTDKGCSLLLYKDARCDMRMLDEAVGNENWDCEYANINGKLFCTVGIRCLLESGETSWVYKQDVGTESNMEPTKGEASDAFKRACFKWGIGRELYTAPFIWVGSDLLESHYQDKGRWVTKDRFRVNHIQVKDGRIVELEIARENGVTVYQMGRKLSGKKKPRKDAKKEETAPQGELQKRIEHIGALKDKVMSMGVTKEGIVSWLKANVNKDISEYTLEDVDKIEQYLEEMIKSELELAKIKAEGINPDA